MGRVAAAPLGAKLVFVGTQGPFVSVTLDPRLAGSFACFRNEEYDS